MSTTPDYGIPYIAASQAQPEITHNEAITLLQALLNGVISRGLDTPPVSPDPGDAYIIGSSPTGAWAGRENGIAVYFGTAWLIIPGNDSDGDPIAMGARQEGMSIWVRDEGLFCVWRAVGSPLAYEWTTLPLGNANTVGYDNSSSGLSATDVQAALDEVADELDSETTALQEAVDEVAAVRAGQAPIVEVGTALTLSVAHNARVIYFTSGDPITVTLPEIATEALPLGFVCTLIRMGDGDVTIVTEGTDEYVAVPVGSPPAPGDMLVHKAAAAVVTLLALIGSPPAQQTWHVEGRLG